MRTFKHAALHKQLQGAECPPTTAMEIERIAFHFVFNPINFESFLIPALRDTERFEESPTCSQCGLSMYTTADKAKTAFKKLVAKHSQIGAVLGDHLAEMKLLQQHGVQTSPDRYGHFALYEYDDVDLASIAVLRGSLLDD